MGSNTLLTAENALAISNAAYNEVDVTDWVEKINTSIFENAKMGNTYAVVDCEASLGPAFIKKIMSTYANLGFKILNSSGRFPTPFGYSTSFTVEWEEIKKS